MFEAVIAVCLASAGEPCRDQLIAGYEADTQAACETALAERPPVPDTGDGLLILGTPICVPAGVALTVEEVAPGVFVHTGQVAEPDRANRGDVSNLGFIIGSASVAVVDTGTARWMGEALWRAIRKRTELPVSHVILTHVHPDHVLGTAAFDGTGAQVVAHANLPRALADRQGNYLESLDRLIGSAAFLGTRTVRVDHAVKDSLSIDLGGRQLHLMAYPMAHTGTDLSVRDDATQVVFAGDLVFDRHAPALDGSLRGWRHLLDQMAEMPASAVIPGHGGPVLNWPDGLTDTRRYLDVLESDTRAAIDAGLRLGEASETVAASEAASWEIFEAYNPRNATVAYTELEWD